MGNLLGDFRYALRSLIRQPTFACVAILTLVLGIGTNTAIALLKGRFIDGRDRQGRPARS